MKSVVAPTSMQNRVLQVEERFPPQTVAMAKSFVSLIGLRDHYTASHSARVANYVRAIATEMDLSEEDLETAVFAALFCSMAFDLAGLHKDEPAAK